MPRLEVIARPFSQPKTRLIAIWINNAQLNSQNLGSCAKKCQMKQTKLYSADGYTWIEILSGMVLLRYKCYTENIKILKFGSFNKFFQVKLLFYIKKIADFKKFHIFALFLQVSRKM